MLLLIIDIITDIVFITVSPKKYNLPNSYHFRMILVGASYHLMNLTYQSNVFLDIIKKVAVLAEGTL